MQTKVQHSRNPQKLLVLIPCYNEEDSICQSLSLLHNAQRTFWDRYRQPLDILVVDDGSEDLTQERLLHHQKNKNYDYDFTIIRHSQNQGYGKTLQTGFVYAQKNEYDWVISFDMDGQHAPDYLEDFYKYICRTEESPDIISGSRYRDPQLFWQPPWKDRFLVNAIITSILNYLGLQLTDSFCGMKAHRVTDINRIQYTLNGYEMPIEMILKANHLGLNIKEIAVPVIYKDRSCVETKERATRFIFARAEQRLEKYLNIIHDLEPETHNISLCLLTDIYRKYYQKYEEITSDNFAYIQMSIIHEIAFQFGAFPCKCVYCTESVQSS
ncbi:MAG: glycosyltransferase family 2 protein [Promethearchaeota archaeon]